MQLSNQLLVAALLPSLSGGSFLPSKNAEGAESLVVVRSSKTKHIRHKGAALNLLPLPPVRECVCVCGLYVILTGGDQFQLGDRHSVTFF